MGRTKHEELLPANATDIRIDVPRRATSCAERRKEHSRWYVEAGLLTRHNVAVSAQERRAPVGVQRRPRRHGLQPLVPRGAPRYVEPDTVRGAYDMNRRRWAEKQRIFDRKGRTSVEFPSEYRIDVHSFFVGLFHHYLILNNDNSIREINSGAKKMKG